MADEKIPLHEQKRQQIKQVLADVHRLHGMDERESMVLMTLDEAMKYWDEMAPDAKNIQAVANAIELECYIRRSERIANEPEQRGRPSAEEKVTPRVTISDSAKMERSRMRAVGKHATVAREYVKAERKANRHATKKGIVRHVKKVAAPTRRAVAAPTGEAGQVRIVRERVFAALEKVSDGVRRTDRQLLPLLGGDAEHFLQRVRFIPWLTIDRTSEGTVFTIDQELRDICDGKAPRPTLDGFSVHKFLKHLRAEIIRRRKANNDERYRRKWSVDSTLMVEQTAILDWIETELDRVP